LSNNYFYFPLDVSYYPKIYLNKPNLNGGILKMPEDNKDEILTIEQCAQLLKVSTWTVYGLVSEERLPRKIFARKVGRSWRILRREVERYLSEEPRSTYQMTLNENNR
jgi:excisionase family DNA binding protein